MSRVCLLSLSLVLYQLSCFLRGDRLLSTHLRQSFFLQNLVQMTEPSFPVRFFRRRSSDGSWECLKAPSLVIVPKQDCLILPSIRLRIPLLQESSHSSTGAVSIIRRHNRVLLSTKSKRKERLLVFHFRSLKDAMAFADRCIQQNPHLIQSNTKDALEPRVASETVATTISQLLVDPGFSNFVLKLQSAIQSSTTCQQLLERLAQQKQTDRTEQL